MHFATSTFALVAALSATTVFADTAPEATKKSLGPLHKHHGLRPYCKEHGKCSKRCPHLCIGNLHHHFPIKPGSAPRKVCRDPSPDAIEETLTESKSGGRSKSIVRRSREIGKPAKGESAKLTKMLDNVGNAIDGASTADIGVIIATLTKMQQHLQGRDAGPETLPTTTAKRPGRVCKKWRPFLGAWGGKGPPPKTCVSWEKAPKHNKAHKSKGEPKSHVRRSSKRKAPRKPRRKPHDFGGDLWSKILRRPTIGQMGGQSTSSPITPRDAMPETESESETESDSASDSGTESSSAGYEL